MQERAAFTKRLGEQTSQLTKSEQQYRLLFDHNPNPMWVYDDSTRLFLAVNEAAIRRYGYTREEFLSMTRHDIRVEPDARSTTEIGDRRGNRGGKPTPGTGGTERRMAVSSMSR